MLFRKIISISIAICFIAIAVTGILFFFTPYQRTTATIHTIFGFTFLLGVLWHIKNNFPSLKHYVVTKNRVSFLKLPFLIILLFCVLLLASYSQVKPIKSFMDWGAELKANATVEVDNNSYILHEVNLNDSIKIEVDFLKGKHFWHPQIAIWLEDESGNYLKSLYVSEATATGTFFGGRDKENFKTFDETKVNPNNINYRRVDALPYWSHKRGIKYADGMYAPTKEQPIVDGISGATFSDNFLYRTSFNHKQTKFKLYLEINVAFDDNEYYSEFDFPDDEIFHSGTGQLGQPSLIYGCDVDLKSRNSYYLMRLLGHGHHSGQNGTLYTDLSTLTTALEIVERILVHVFVLDN